MSRCCFSTTCISRTIEPRHLSDHVSGPPALLPELQYQQDHRQTRRLGEPLATSVPPLKTRPRGIRKTSDQDQTNKITPCSLCLPARPRRNLGLREQQGSNESSAEGDRMSTGFSGALARREDCGPTCLSAGDFGNLSRPRMGATAEDRRLPNTPLVSTRSAR